MATIDKRAMRQREWQPAIVAPGPAEVHNKATVSYSTGVCILVHCQTVERRTGASEREVHQGDPRDGWWRSDMS